MSIVYSQFICSALAEKQAGSGEKYVINYKKQEFAEETAKKLPESYFIL